MPQARRRPPQRRRRRGKRAVPGARPRPPRLSPAAAFRAFLLLLALLSGPGTALGCASLDQVGVEHLRTEGAPHAIAPMNRGPGLAGGSLPPGVASGKAPIGS